MTRMIASVLAALALAGMAAPGALAEKSKTVSIAVSYADLNLATADGAKSMLGRLKQASKRICGRPVSHSPAERRLVQACVNEVLNRSVNQLNAPMVTAMFWDSSRFQLASR
jgi:UrcA family protein